MTDTAAIVVLLILGFIGNILTILRVTMLIKKYRSTHTNKKIDYLPIEDNFPEIVKKLYTVAKIPGVSKVGLMAVKGYPSGNSKTCRKVIFSTEDDDYALHGNYVENSNSYSKMLKICLSEGIVFWDIDKIGDSIEALYIKSKGIGSGYVTVLGISAQAEFLFYAVDYEENIKVSDISEETFPELFKAKVFIQKEFISHMKDFRPIWN